MRGQSILTQSVLAFSLIILFLLSLVPATHALNFRPSNIDGTQFRIDAASLQTPLVLQYPGEFHDYDEMQAEIMYFHTHAPELIDLEVIGQSYEGRDITCLRITNESNPLQKAKTLVVAHHHGREQITVEAALRFILRLLNGYGVNPTLTEYVNTQEIYVIPSLNPDTLEHTVNLGNHWLRKNLRPFDHDNDGAFDEDGVEDVNMDGVISGFDVYTTGGVYLYTYYEGIDNDVDGAVNEDPVGYVDLNRNYPSGFGNPGSSNDPYSQVYHGPTAFSEPETDSFRNFTLDHRFAMAFSLHSGINATYFPSYQSGLFVEPQLYQTLYAELDGLLPPWWNDDDDYALQGSPAHLATGYFGLWQDWMYAERQTLVPICFEIYRNASSVSASSVTEIYRNATHYIEEWTGIYGYFNPVASGIDHLFTDIIPAFDYLLQLTPRLFPVLTGKIETNTTVTLTINLANLSPRLGTIDDIEFRNTNGTLLHTTPAFSAGMTVPLQVQFDLTDIGSSNAILIGNNYTGYVELSLTDVTPLPPIPGFPLAAIVIGTIAALGTFIVLRRRKHSTPIRVDFN